MHDIMKIFKSLEESGLLIKGVRRETIKNEAKKQKRRLLRMLLGALSCQFIRKSINK